MNPLNALETKLSPLLDLAIPLLSALFIGYVIVVFIDWVKEKWRL